MIENLLVITDQNDDETFALEKAREIAIPFNAKITVMSFISEEDNRNKVGFLQQYRGDLQEKVEPIFGEGVEVRAEVIPTDDIPESLKAECDSRGIDLIVKTGNRTESLFYTPLDWRIIRELDCPILIASEKKWKSKHTILATLDVQEDEPTQNRLNQDVLKWSSVWAEKTKDNVEACYVIPMSEVLEDMDLTSEAKVKAKKEPAATKTIISYLDAASLKGNKIHISAGKPEKEIPHIANQIKADLVVMGSVGRKGFEGFVLGNTAEQVLHHLYTDILIVRPTS